VCRLCHVCIFIEAASIFDSLSYVCVCVCVYRMYMRLSEDPRSAGGGISVGIKIWEHKMREQKCVSEKSGSKTVGENVEAKNV